MSGHDSPDIAEGCIDLVVEVPWSRREISRHITLPNRNYRVRGAPSNALSRSAFARNVGRHRTTIWRWERREWLKPARSRAGRPFYLRDQLDEFEAVKIVRTAAVKRAIWKMLARQELARRCRHER
jgi:hypothetical protein